MKSNNHSKRGSQSKTHPDMRADAPGRIPESLIDAAIDGELNEDMQREIAHALKYDPIRKQELLDTSDAINALQMPISMPDFSDPVLARADRNRRFIPASWRRHVRAGRIGIAAAFLMTLMTVAGLQTIYPRLTTIASHPTPVSNIEQAVGHDTDRLAQTVTNEVHMIRASVAPMADMLLPPGRADHRFEITLASTPSAVSASGSYPSQVRFVGVGHGIAAVCIDNDINAPRARVYSSLGLVGSNNMQSWVYNSRSSSARSYEESRFPSRTDKESIELDVQALP
jgi:hypothetical protein